MRVWITGIAGLIGSHLAEKLLEEDHEVRGNDNFLCGDSANVPTGAISIPIDCCDFALLKQAMDEFKPDVVAHCAATAAEGFSVFSPHFITKNIYEASISTFSAAIASGAKRIVYFSSMARYGNGFEYCKPPFKEEMPPAPIDPYGIAKVAAEDTLKALCSIHNVKWSILVPHNVIGIRQQITPYRNVATIFLNRLKLGLPVYIYGDGGQKRSFSPIADCIYPIARAVSGHADGEVVNIGPDDNEMTINKLLIMCEAITGKKAVREYLPARPLTDNVKDAYCSAEKSRKLLGYESKQSLINCIREMDFYLEPKPFSYDFPIEINSDIVPETWRKRL